MLTFLGEIVPFFAPCSLPTPFNRSFNKFDITVAQVVNTDVWPEIFPISNLKTFLFFKRGPCQLWDLEASLVSRTSSRPIYRRRTDDRGLDLWTIGVDDVLVILAMGGVIR